MNVKELDLKKLLHDQALRIVVEKLCMIRGISPTELSTRIDGSTDIVTECIFGEQSFSATVENEVMNALKVDEYVWETILNDVTRLLLEYEKSDSLEIWFVILKNLYINEGKNKTAFYTVDDSDSWDK